MRRARKFQQITELWPSRRAVLVALVTLVAPAFFTACASQEGTIGAVLGQRPDGRLFVRDVPPALAAARAGLHPGDEILLVDGKDVRAMNAAELHQALSGEVAAPVKLTIVRAETVFRVTLPRTAAPRVGASPGG